MFRFCLNNHTLNVQLAQKYIIRGVKMNEEGNKLLSMGILPGGLVEVIRLDPWGNTYYVKVDGQAIALRRQELAMLELIVAQ